MNNFFKSVLLGGGVVFDLARGIIVLIIVLSLVNAFWMTIFVVDGLSMEPNLHDRELVLLQKNAYTKSKDPKRGDVVVVQYPGDPAKKRYVKRVIGLPGEKIETKTGKVFINGKILKELYVPYGVTSEPDGNWTLSGIEYFLMGDNRPNSNDSRYFGGVEKRFFLGHALYIIYPRMRSLAL